jgi:hypothetical protein
MRNIVLLLALAGSVVACETQGVVESSYKGADGSHLSLQQFKNAGRFYYALSASVPTRDCATRSAVKVVAMGADGHMRVRVERTLPDSACDS